MRGSRLHIELAVFLNMESLTVRSPFFLLAGKNALQQFTVLLKCGSYLITCLRLMYVFVCFKLSGYQDVNMDLPGNNRDDFKSEQAIDDFYKHTSYDRGHLNPNNYQCDRGRLATFTLTNAVPMDPCFNQQHWKQYEDEIKRIVKHYYGKGLPYFVTGVVPSSEKIPVPILDTVEHDRDFSMVTVPSHVWTALCFDANKKEESFSLGYIGENKPEALINILSIHDLEQQLIGLYG